MKHDKSTSKKSTKKSTGIQYPSKWVVVQLSPAGEREKNVSILERSVHRFLGKLMVFVPAACQSAKDEVRNDSHTMFYMEGYIFVEFRENINYGKLSDTTYFDSVLSNKTQLFLLDDSQVAPLRKGVEELKVGDFSVGDSVRVIRGSFKNLIGKIHCVYSGGEAVQVDLKLSSKPMLIDFPSGSIQKVDI